MNAPVATGADTCAFRNAAANERGDFYRNSESAFVPRFARRFQRAQPVPGRHPLPHRAWRSSDKDPEAAGCSLYGDSRCVVRIATNAGVSVLYVKGFSRRWGVLRHPGSAPTGHRVQLHQQLAHHGHQG